MRAAVLSIQLAFMLFDRILLGTCYGEHFFTSAHPKDTVSNQRKGKQAQTPEDYG
jgi:hypothetical protein